MTAYLAWGGHIAFVLTIMKNITTATIIFKIVLSISNHRVTIRAAYQKNRRRFFLIDLRLFLFPTKCTSLALCGSPIRYSLIPNRYVG